MKKTLLASLGLTLMLSTSAGVAFAQEDIASPTKESIKLYDNGTDREPNNSFEEASEVWLGDDIYGSIGKLTQGNWDSYDVFKFKAFQTKRVNFKIEGDKYPNAWLRLVLSDSNGHEIRTAVDRQNTLGKELEAGKWYYIAVEVPGYEIGQQFDYRLSATIEQ
ncbi:hypothetical protein C1I60_15215 [Paenibacillus terrae]|uniref:Uncharacterized protein n=1 Tax=Paenibacillus terrae TaxID=159743 RepID=A0A4U2PWD5_9BACL|nr:hypothetical protein [Paenibacillus terrae]TKH42890.1 hypothetical protein C1I60_15215 [Paenibacillus terrae]